MDKNQVIEFIKRQLNEGVISLDDLRMLTGAAPAPLQEPQLVPQQNLAAGVMHGEPRDLTQILYAIGATIAIVGVGILVAQNWDEIGAGGRILSTTGIALIAYTAGILLRAPHQDRLSQVMFIIAAALAPLGAFVLMHEAGLDFTFSSQIFIALIFLVMSITAWFANRKNILILMMVLSASWAYYAFLLDALSFSLFNIDEIFKWASMLLAAAYVMIGYGLSLFNASGQSDAHAVQRVLYAFGTLGLLGFGITIGGAFDLLYILLIFASFYGSILLKSRAMLVLGSLFLIGHIIKLTSEYFVDSVGWPIALIAIGFMTIGVGYLAFSLNRHFLSKNAS